MSNSLGSASLVSAIKARYRQRPFTHGPDQFGGRLDPGVGTDAQQPRGVEVDLRARYLGLHDGASATVNLDPAEQGDELEALRAPLAHRDPKPQPPPEIFSYLARPVPEGDTWRPWRRVRPLYPLDREEAIRPQRDVHTPLVVVAGAVPEPLRGVHPEREDHPLGDAGTDRVVADLQVRIVESRLEQISEQGRLVLAHRLDDGHVLAEPV